MKKTMTCQALEKNTKDEGIFPEPKGSECQLPAPWDFLGSSATDQDAPAPQANWNLKGKLGKLGISEKLLRMTILGGDLGQKRSQLFWGLPSLHSESIVATLLVLPLNSYPLEPHLVLFNGVCRAVAAPGLGHGSAALPQPHTLPLSFAGPQPFPRGARPQPQTLPFPRAHVRCPPSPMRSPPLPRGRTFQRPHTRTVSGVLGGNEHLQGYLLQNHQDSLWSLVPEWQQYGTPFGLLVPSLPLVSQPSRNYVSTPRTGHFHFGSELQDNLEPYGPNNPIPPWCYHQASGRTGVLEVMVPRFKPTETSPHSCKCTRPQRTVHWDQSCSDLRTAEPRRSGSFCERASVKPQLNKDVAQNLGQILGKCPFGSPQMISGCYVLKGLRVVPETEIKWACPSGVGLENEQDGISRKSLDQRQTRSILRLHVSRKLWQITMGRIPIKVCCSWLAEDEMLKNSPTGSTHCDTSVPAIPFLDHKTQKMLEAHLIRYRVSQKWGPPIKVIESIKFYMSREAKTWPLPQPDHPLSSGIDLKRSFPRPLGENSKLSRKDNMETADVDSIIDHLPLTISHADGEGEGPLGKSHPGNGYEVTETTQATEGDRLSSDDNTSQYDAELQIRPWQEQPIKELVAESKSQNEVASPSRLAVTGGREIVGKHPAPVLIAPDTLLGARDVSVVLSGLGPGCNWEGPVRQSEVGSEPASAAATPHNPSRVSLPQEQAVLDFKKQLFNELKLKLEQQSQSQAEGYESDVSFASDSVAGFSLSSSNSASSTDVSVFRDFHPHLCNTGTGLDPWPGVLGHNAGSLAPAEKRPASPDNGKSETPKSEKRSQPVAGKSDKKSHPPESYFRRKIGQLFQWLYSRKDNTRRRTEKDRALFMSCGPPEAHELMATLGKLLEDKLLCRQRSGFLEWSQKNCLQAQPEPTNRQPSNQGASYAQHGGGKPNCYRPQTAIAPGPGQRHHVSFGQQPQFWSYFPSCESRDL
ncbi:spermatogenesis-associated protein 31D1-like [Mesocricetus auratus]|uniref:Spermatogenesis-associated protein 31D1-like n=1 Tax=Mesocricetus auratus TaxID=10036 RepID=A0ABM2YBF5_MESAU|nr:spermatogenesis-associated protein 31D1-like [Mesocricetus auratus]